MNQSKLTKVEKKWIQDVQNIINKCPSKRIAFYTIGDNGITAYDHTKYDEITDLLDKGIKLDFGPAVTKCGADFNESLVFNNAIESTAG